MPLPIIAGIVVRVAVGAAAKVIAKRLAAATAKKASQKAVPKAMPKAAPKPAAPKPAPKGSGKGPGNTAGKHKAKRSKQDPCKHKRDKKQKKYVVYKVTDRSGKVYVGRTSGGPSESTRSILARRSAGHHRADVKGLTLERVFETNSYSAVRGAEQIAKEKYSTAKQIEPISDRNERRQDYLDCAKSKMNR